MRWRYCHWWGVLFDFVIWLLVPCVFLFLYIDVLGAAFDLAGEHILIVFSLWLGCFSLRVSVWRWFWGDGKKLFAGFLFFTSSAFVLIWYLVVVFGLFSWGRIATWELLSVYFIQAPEVLEVLDVSIWLIALCLLLFLFLFFGVVLFFWRIDYSWWVASNASFSGVLIFVVLGFMVFGAQYVRLLYLSDVHFQEPISISFFGAGSAVLQSHSLAISPAVDSLESKEAYSYSVAKSFSSRNVVLIVGDALRSDHMGAYGYSRATTPFLSKSIEKYQTFVVKPAKAVCAESSCGLMAIASSRPLHLFPSKPFTFYEVLRRHGYKLNFILSGDHTNFYGLKSYYGDFDFYFDGASQGGRYVNDDYVVLEKVAGLPLYDGLQPVFFQFHLMSTHGLGLKYSKYEKYKPSVNYYKWTPEKGGRVSPSELEAMKAVNYYDNGVIQFDGVVESLLSALERKGYLKDAVVVIVADHGEMLGERGRFGHQYGVGENVLNIPFIVQRRGYRGGDFGAWPLASQMDVAPTIMAELGVSSPSVWLGQSLQSDAMDRVLYFQQNGDVGLYSSGDEGKYFKYWREVSSGKEYFYGLGGGEGEREVTVEPGLLKKWRQMVMESAVDGVR